MERQSMPKKILLLRPSYRDSRFSNWISTPAGLGIISENLSKNKIDNRIYDMEVNSSVPDLFNYISIYKPDFIGVGMMTFKYLYNYVLINSIKQRFPEVVIIVGGPHASTFREKIFDHCESVSIVVPLEGEEILVEICKGEKPLNQIQGIFYRKGNEIIETDHRDFIKDLDNFPFPTYSKLNMDYYDLIPVISSRGCPYKCIFCPVKTTIGQAWRSRSAESILEELDYWVTKRGRSLVQIEDDNFTFNRQRVLEICEGIRRKGLDKKIRINLANGIRADKVDEELLSIMKKSGFSVLAFGVESGSESVLKSICKGESLSKIEEAIKLACKLNFVVCLTFVLGSPGETEDDVKKSIAFAQKYPVSRISFYHLVPYPNTQLYDWVIKSNRFRYKNPEYLNDASVWINEPVFFTDEMSVKQKKELYVMANSVARKHGQKSVRRNTVEYLSNTYKVPKFAGNIMSLFYKKSYWE